MILDDSRKLYPISWLRSKPCLSCRSLDLSEVFLLHVRQCHCFEVNAEECPLLCILESATTPWNIAGRTLSHCLIPMWKTYEIWRTHCESIEWLSGWIDLCMGMLHSSESLYLQRLKFLRCRFRIANHGALVPTVCSGTRYHSSLWVEVLFGCIRHSVSQNFKCLVHQWPPSCVFDRAIESRHALMSFVKFFYHSFANCKSDHLELSEFWVCLRSPLPSLGIDSNCHSLSAWWCATKSCQIVVPLMVYINNRFFESILWYLGNKFFAVIVFECQSWHGISYPMSLTGVCLITKT